MTRGFEFSINEYYHVYNRGNNKQRIFVHPSDQRRFRALLYLCNNTKPVRYSQIKTGNYFNLPRGGNLVDIGSYCIMYNHFHLLLHEATEGGISRFMQKLTTAYAMYFRTRYKREGTIFEGSFKAKHLDNDEYLKYIFAYIHLNPVEHIDRSWKEDGIKDLSKVKKYIRQYAYSSFLDFCGENREERKVLNLSAFPSYFPGEYDFEDYLKIWLEFKDSHDEV